MTTPSPRRSSCNGQNRPCTILCKGGSSSMKRNPYNQSFLSFSLIARAGAHRHAHSRGSRRGATSHRDSARHSIHRRGRCRGASHRSCRGSSRGSDICKRHRHPQDLCQGATARRYGNTRRIVCRGTLPICVTLCRCGRRLCRGRHLCNHRRCRRCRCTRLCGYRRFFRLCGRVDLEGDFLLLSQLCGGFGS